MATVTRTAAAGTGGALLDGYRLLEAAGVRVPDDVFRVVLSGHATVFTEVERAHLAEFSNLTYLDVGGHNLALSSLAALPSLTELHLPCNGLQTIHVPLPTTSAGGVMTAAAAGRASSAAALRTNTKIVDATIASTTTAIPAVVITNETGAPSQPYNTRNTNGNDDDDNNIDGNGTTETVISSPFASLRILDLSYNVLQPRCLSQLSRMGHLTELNLSGNDLPELPNDMSLFRSLKKLSLRRNRLGQQYRNSSRHNVAVHARAMAMSVARATGTELPPVVSLTDDDQNNNNINGDMSQSGTLSSRVSQRGSSQPTTPGRVGAATAAATATTENGAATTAADAPTVTNGNGMASTSSSRHGSASDHRSDHGIDNGGNGQQSHNWDRIALMSLASIPRLEELDLSENHFEEIPHDLACQFKQLRVLNVSYNFFASEESLIPLVDCCPSLKWLDVRGNLFNVPRLHVANRADDFPHMKYAFGVAGVNVVFAQPKPNSKYDESHIMRARVPSSPSKSVRSKAAASSTKTATTAATAAATVSSQSEDTSDQTFITTNNTATTSGVSLPSIDRSIQVANESRDEKYDGSTAVATSSSAIGGGGRSRIWQAVSSSSPSPSPPPQIDDQPPIALSYDEIASHPWFQVTMSGSAASNKDMAVRSVRALKTALNGRLPAVSFAPENVRRYEKGTKARRGRVIAHKEFHVGERKMGHIHTHTAAAGTNGNGNGGNGTLGRDFVSSRSRNTLYNRMDRTIDHITSSTNATAPTAPPPVVVSSSHEAAASRSAIASSVSAGVAARVAARRRHERDDEAVHDLVTSVSYAFRQATPPATSAPVLPNILANNHMHSTGGHGHTTRLTL